MNAGLLAPPEKPTGASATLRVLLIDDDGSAWITVVVKYLRENAGCEVTVCKSLADATTLVADRSFDVVVVDVLFEREGMRGDDWLLRNLDSLGSATKLILTGETAFMKRPLEVEAWNIPVLRKGLDDGETLAKWLQKIRRARATAATQGTAADYLADTSRGARTSTGQGPATLADEIESAVIDLFHTWLSRMVAKQAAGRVPDVLIEGQAVSYKKVLADWEAGGSLGRHVLELFIDDMKAQIG